MKKVNNDITVYYSELVVNPAFPYSGDISEGASLMIKWTTEQKIRQVWNS